MSGSGVSFEDLLDERYEEGYEEGYGQAKKDLENQLSRSADGESMDSMNGVHEVGYRRQKQMSETKKEDSEAEMLAADVKQIVAAMLCGFSIETKAGVAANNTAEVEEERKAVSK